MYQEIILDHYRAPHGAGLREPFDAESFQINPTCGDEITLRVKLDGDTVSPSRATRSVISSPHVGLIWNDSASNGSRRPQRCGAR